MHAHCTRHLVLPATCLALLAPPTTTRAADSQPQPPEVPARKLALRHEATAAGFRHRTLDADGGHTQIGDINGDGRADIVPHQPQLLCWLEYPGFEKRVIRRGTLTGKQGTFSGDRFALADMDGDGDLDLVTGEHRARPGGAPAVPDNERIQIWENDGKGHFTCRTVDIGKESHLGARVSDLDGDGDLDIVSIAWRNFQFLHVWRNDAVR